MVERALVLRRGMTLNWSIAALVATAYGVVCIQYSSILFQDYPNHLARAVVISDLMFDHGVHFGSVFSFHPMAYPYILGDLLMAPLVHWFGPSVATGFWTVLALLSMPMAVLFYQRMTRTAPEAGVFTFLICLYFSTDWFFLMGFLNFRLAIAMTIFALALVERLRARWSWLTFYGFCIAVLIGYLIHLAFIVFLAAAVGVTGLLQLRMKTTTLQRESLYWIPIAAAVAWHLGNALYDPEKHEVVAMHFLWGTFYWKLRRLDWDLVRFSEPIDVLFAFVLAASLVFLVLRQGRKIRPAVSPAALSMLALAASFLALHVMFPMYFGDPGYLDVRWLALAWPCMAFACVFFVDQESNGRAFARTVVVGGAALFVITNLVYFAWSTTADQLLLDRYRSIVATIPDRANVLPVYTRDRGFHRYTLLHAAAFAVIDRGATIPYLFSGDRGQPMKYFRYIQPSYAPAFDWYTTPSAAVDWRSIQCIYDYLLVMKPFDSNKILAATKTIQENGSAALLAVDRHACR